MKLFSKKKYTYLIPENKTKQNKKSMQENLFIFSPLPLSESIHIGQLYTLFLQDTFLKFLSKYKNWDSSSSYLRSFSHNVYKSLGNQIIHTNKILKQKKQNTNKLTQSFIAFDTRENNDLNVLDEHTVLKARKLFFDLKKNIKKKHTIVYWDTSLGMEIDSTDHLVKEFDGKEYQIKFFVDGKGDSIVTHTQIPYTFFSTVAIAVNPKDRRYKKHFGRNVIVPIINKKIPIITDESIVMTEGQGAKAINPGHDEFSLEIAKKHNLPLDVYSINEKGKFTEICGRFSGGKLEEFRDNIVKFLADIGNLSMVGIQKQQRHTNGYNEQVLERISKEVYYLNANIEAEMIENQQEKDFFAVSSYGKVGGLLPICRGEQGDYIFSEEKFIQESSPDIIFTLLLIHIVLEGRLSSRFSLEKCIQMLFESSYVNGYKKYERYLQYYTNYNLKKEDIAQVRKILDKVISSLDTKPLRNLLDNSPYINTFQNGEYELLWKEILDVHEDVTLQESLYFHHDFSLLPLYQELLENAKDIKICFDHTQRKQSRFLHTVQTLCNHDNTFESLYFDPLKDGNGSIYSFKNSKINYTKLQEIQKKLGPDVARMLLITSEGKLDNVKESVDYISRLIQKIWNMCRYVFNEQTVKNDVSTILEKNIKSLHEFDLWILDKTKETREKISDSVRNDLYLDPLRILEEYILSYLDHYLEIQKYKSSIYSKHVLVYCLVFLLQNIDIYLPLLGYQIRKEVDYTTIEINKISVDVMGYKANIFNDIITKIKELKLSNNYMKHEYIDCIIQCGPDMSLFINENKDILTNMIAIRTISISEDKTPLDSEYLSEKIIDIVLGIKKIDSEQTKKQLQDATEKQIADIQDEIQRKKILLGRIIPLGNIQKIEEKKAEIQQLKENLEKMKSEM